jgi:hypothetical protein
LGSPLALRFAGTRDTGAGVGARDECEELSLDIVSAIGGGGSEFLETFRGFATMGDGVGLGGGSAFDRILEKAIGSAGLLGV